MNEAVLIERVMKKINRFAEQQDAVRVTSVNLWLGALSQTTAGQLRAQFVLASRDSLAENASLIIKVSNNPSSLRAREVVLRSIEVESQVR